MKRLLIVALIATLMGIAISPKPRIHIAARLGSSKAMLALARHYYYSLDANGYQKGNHWLLRSALSGNYEAQRWITDGREPGVSCCEDYVTPEPTPEWNQMRLELNRHFNNQSHK